MCLKFSFHQKKTEKFKQRYHKNFKTKNLLSFICMQYHKHKNFPFYIVKYRYLSYSNFLKLNKILRYEANSFHI